ncbi:MAG: hypothetical protein OXG19_04360 [Chloroflexi bacterium]|nr:hypothetical protein [Chloroflexota bacterium]
MLPRVREHKERREWLEQTASEARRALGAARCMPPWGPAGLADARGAL